MQDKTQSTKYKRQPEWDIRQELHQQEECKTSKRTRMAKEANFLFKGGEITLATCLVRAANVKEYI